MPYRIDKSKKNLELIDIFIEIIVNRDSSRLKIKDGVVFQYIIKGCSLAQVDCTMVMNRCGSSPAEAELF